MKQMVVAMLMVAGAVGAVPAVAGADTVNLDIDLKLGRDSFRVGGRVLGGQSVWGAWLNGQVRDRGFSLDGRLQSDDKAYNFKLDADILDWLLRPLPIRLPQAVAD
jgi:hypothetical protein